MAPKKHRKRMRLPNGFGSIKYLGSGRRNPYAVYPPVTEWTPKSPVTPKALAYKPTWEEAYEVLTAYNMEKAGKIRIGGGVYIDRTPTFAELYEDFYQEMLRLYSSQGAEKRAEIVSLYESADWKDYAIKVHALKSTSLTIGAQALSAQAKELEMAGKRGDVDFIQTHHHALLCAHEELCTYITRL